ncbi:MAG: hypothetical protein U0163_11995 [Gemmatimonadaceae bacterium]
MDRDREAIAAKEDEGEMTTNTRIEKASLGAKLGLIHEHWRPGKWSPS